jgi:3-dehydroquinate dehydratase
MGKEGRVVRIYSALWGNEFNFAPAQEAKGSAEGQIPKNKLEEILALLTE